MHGFAVALFLVTTTGTVPVWDSTSASFRLQELRISYTVVDTLQFRVLATTGPCWVGLQQGSGLLYQKLDGKGWEAAADLAWSLARY